jgi:hypothetical protein
MIRAHPRKERSHAMPDEAAFFHQVRALVHQSRTILAPYLCGDHTFDVAAHELAPVIRAFLQHPAPATPVRKPQPPPATPLWRRLTIGRLSFKRETPPETSPSSDLDVWVSALAPGYAHADEKKVRAVVTEALRIAQSEHAAPPKVELPLAVRSRTLKIL